MVDRDFEYKPVIGLEIHVELQTKAKMFCQCSANYWKKEPNSQICPVCLGMPGTLPVPNRKAIEWTMKLGRALNCKINKEFEFDRKHYFYPDLPKGYQISQYDKPIASNGWLQIPAVGGDCSQKLKRIRIREVHLEEDTAKLIHRSDFTLIDFNRAGVPLVEIVTEPDLESADEAKRFLEELQLIIRYLGISNADMEKGSMRLEPNVSVMKRRKGLKSRVLPKYKVEIKNINSFNFVKKAIDFEIKRQIALLKKGNIPIQETRGFVESTGETVPQRIKEEAEDYRYFPEPDIPPFHFTDEEIEEIVGDIPELPAEKVERYVTQFGIRADDAFVLTRDKELANYFEEVVKDGRVTGSERKGLTARLASLMVNKKIDVKLPPKEFIDRALGMFVPKETDETLLAKVVEEVVSKNSNVVLKIKKGEIGKVNFLIGEVMRKMKGQADPKRVREVIMNSIQ